MKQVIGCSPLKKHNDLQTPDNSLPHLNRISIGVVVTGEPSTSGNEKHFKNRPELT